jgi:hypothetical protein
MKSEDSGKWLRVTLNDGVLRELMEKFPKLSRTEIADVVSSHGPMRETVEGELQRISSRKR